MQPFQWLQLNNIGRISLYYRRNSLETVFDNIKKDIRGLVGIGADDGDVEELLLVFVELFFDHRDVELADLG